MENGYFKMTIACVFVFLGVSLAGAHCEIPCGIYDDEARMNYLAEHITTMEKAMISIQELKNSEPINYNQLVRWITNKENHAEAFQEIVSQYFMTQRIKVDMKEYEKHVILLHKMLVYAMKCKQTTDLENIKTLKSFLTEFRKLYSNH